MNNKVLFRTAFQGFKKEDVVAYIDQISKDTNRMLAEKDAEIKEMAAHLQEAEQKSCALESERDELSSKLHEQQEQFSIKDEQISLMSEKVEQLEKELNNQEQQAHMPDGYVSAETFATLEAQYNIVLAEKNALAKQIEAYKEFDGVQRDLGTIIIKAEKNAAEITAKAKKESDDMVSRARRISQEMLERRMSICNEIAETFDRSKYNIDEAHRTLCEKMDSIKSAIDAFYSSLELSRKIVHENVSAVTDIKCDFEN